MQPVSDSTRVQQGPQAMNGEPLRAKVMIVNAQGLHMRPMSAFVTLARQYQSTVHVSKQGDQRADGKSPLSMLSLGAEQGTELTLEVCGPDQKEALDALVGFLNRLVEEDEEQANGPSG